MGDDRLARLDPHSTKPGAQDVQTDEPAVLINEPRPLQMASGRDMAAPLGDLLLAGILALATGIDDARFALFQGCQHVIPGRVTVDAKDNSEGLRRNGGRFGAYRSAGLLPEREVPIDQAGAADAQVAEQPPDSRRVELPLAVVDEHLGLGPDSQRGDPGFPGRTISQARCPGG